MSYAVKCTLLDHRFNHAAFFGTAAFQSMDHSHGHFAFAKVTCHWLSQHALGRGQIKDIVHDLESHTQIAAVSSNLILLLRSCAAQHCSHPHAYRKQARSLTI